MREQGGTEPLASTEAPMSVKIETSSPKRLCMLNDDPSVFAIENKGVREPFFPPLSELQGLPKEYNNFDSDYKVGKPISSNSLFMTATDYSKAYVEHMVYAMDKSLEGPEGTEAYQVLEDKMYLCDSKTKKCMKEEDLWFPAHFNIFPHDQLPQRPIIADGWSREKNRYTITMSERGWLFAGSFCVIDMKAKSHSCVKLEGFADLTPRIFGEKAIFIDAEKTQIEGTAYVVIYDLNNLKKPPQRIFINAQIASGNIGNQALAFMSRDDQIILISRGKQLIDINPLNETVKVLPFTFPADLEPMELSPSGEYFFVKTMLEDKQTQTAKVFNLSTGEIHDIGALDTKFHGVTACLP